MVLHRESWLEYIKGDIGIMRFKRVFPPSPHQGRRCSWTFGFLVLILPTFSHADCDYKTVMSDAERNACISPEQRRESGHKRVSQERPSALIAQRKLSPEELAYTRLLASYEQRYPIIDQRSPKYVKRIDDEVAARVGILADSGMSLTTALTQALDEEFTPRPQATLQSDALWKAALGGAFMFLAFWLVVAVSRAGRSATKKASALTSAAAPIAKEIARSGAALVAREAYKFATRNKACPFCAETIKRRASVCKHCLRDIPW